MMPPRTILPVIAVLCLLAGSAPGADNESFDAARLEARSKEFPFDDELRVLARDLTSADYRRVLDTMIPTDLEAEWQRVATSDNYQTFLTRNGGRDKVLASPRLKEAYEVRRDIAARFIEIVREAYLKRKKEPPFDQAKVDDLCLRAMPAGAKPGADGRFPIVALTPAAGSEQNWPQFRGPTAQGIVVDPRFPEEWSATKNVRWKNPLPGKGNSSPIVWGDRLFVTSAADDGKERWLLCYAIADGRKLWQHTAPISDARLETLYHKNTFASGTPVTDGERVIAFFGNSGLVCCDFSGREIWRYDLGSFPTMHGPGTTPVIYHDRIIFIQDQTVGESVFVALNKEDGRLLWKQKRPSGACWSTPLVVRSGDRDELLYNGSHFFAAYSPETGKELWRCAGPSRESVPMPAVGGGLIYSTSGRNGPMLAIRPGGTGDVTATHTVWSVPRGGPHVPTPCYVQGRLFQVNDVGVATCLEATTGKLIWQQRLPGRFSMSVLSAGDRLLATSESGATYILRAADRFEQLAVNDLGETTLATPALLGGRIYFRTAEHLICIGEQ